MTIRTMEVAIGVALFVASLILIAGIIWLSEQTVGWRTYELTVVFESAQGLKRGDAVTVVGIKIGKVDRVSFRKRQAEVRVFLETDQKIPRDSQFVLESGDLLGGKIINILPGESTDYLASGETVRGTSGTGFEELSSAFVELQDRFRVSLDSLFKPDNIQSINATLQGLQTTTDNLAWLLAQNRNNLDLTLQNIRQGSERVNTILDGNDALIDTTIFHLAAVSKNLAALSRDLATTSSTLRNASQAIDEQKGTLGALVYDRQLYDNLNKASYNLNAILEEIQKQPQKYLNISVF